MPPPTPVPSVSSTRSSTSLPAPIHFSPSAAALASFSRITGVPRRLLSSSRTGKFSRYGRLLELVMKPSFIRMKPGTPTPIPASSPGPCIPRSVEMAETMSPSTASRPFSKSVAPPILSSIFPARSIAAARRFVPPKSIPIEYSAIDRHHSTRPAGPIFRLRLFMALVPASATRYNVE